MSLVRRDVSNYREEFEDIVVKEYCEVLSNGETYNTMFNVMVFGTDDYFSDLFDIFGESICVFNSVIGNEDFGEDYYDLCYVADDTTFSEERREEAQRIVDGIEEIGTDMLNYYYPDGFEGEIVNVLRKLNFFHLCKTAINAKETGYEVIEYNHSPLQEVW